MKRYLSLFLAVVCMFCITANSTALTSSECNSLDAECIMRTGSDNPAYDGKLYGYNAMGGATAEGFIAFSAETGNIEHQDAQQFRLIGGAYYNGLVYAYGIELIDNFYEIPHWYVIDPTTWTVQQDELRNVCYDMTYDYSTDTMYAITPYMMAEHMQLCSVDITNGQLSVITEITLPSNEKARMVACGRNGMLFLISSTGNLYTVNKTTGAANLVGGTGKSFCTSGDYYDIQQSMIYDPTDGMLYAAQYNGTSSTLLVINPETAAVVSERPLGAIRLTSLFAFYNPEDYANDPEPTPEPTPEPPVEEHDGDINGDGNTNTADAVFAMRYALGLIELTETQLIHGDVNEDGVVNIADAIGIMRIAMGLN